MTGTIAIFGGSFDPVHNGHIMVAKAIVKNKLADSVWFMPSYLTPGKEKQISNWLYRLEMLQIACNGLKKIEVSDFEIKQKEISYTYLLIRKLKKEYPNQNFSFVMGSDSFASFSTWEKADEIAQSVSIIVYPRQGYETKKSDLAKYNATLLNLQTKNVSSTEIRKANPTNLNSKVIEYICENGMYSNYLDGVSMSQARKEHSMAVAKEAYEIGKQISPKIAYKAYFAGMLHDIAKEQKGATGPNHGKLGATYCKDILKIEDKQILSAITKHTLSDPIMNKLDKIVYVADVTFRDNEKLGKLARVDIDKAFIEILKIKKQHLERQGLQPESIQVKSWNKWLKK